MRELTNTDTPTVEISVRQTDHLSKKAKAHPENHAAEYLERAFRRLNIPYRILVDYPPVAGLPAPSEGKSAQLKAFSEKLNDGSLDGVCKDSNVLLTDRDGGGVAYAHAKAAIGPGGTLTQGMDEEGYEMVEWVSKDDPRSCLYAVLHEVGHNLSQRPYSGHDNSWGRTWNDDDAEAWYRTPRGHGNDNNFCGEWCEPQKEGYEVRKCLYYADCARDHLKINEAALLKSD